MDKLSIFGGSNAFMRAGWSNSFSDQFKVINFSMGASSSGLGIYSRLARCVEESPFVVIESSVSDQDHLMRKVVSEDLINMYINGMYSGLKNSHPISLIMPTEFGLNDVSLRRACEQHKIVARENFIPFFNAYDILDLVKIRLKHFKHGVFRDMGHMYPSLAKIIGKYAMKVHKASIIQLDRAAYFDTELINNFSTLSAEDMASDFNLNLEEAGSSLLKLPVVIFKDSITLKIDRPKYLLGVVVDVSGSNCNLCIQGESKDVVKNIHAATFSDKKSQFRYITLSKPLKVSGSMVVKCCGNQRPVTENTLGEIKHEDRNITANIGGFLFSDVISFKNPSEGNGQDYSSYDEFQEGIVQPIVKECAEEILGAISFSQDLLSPVISGINESVKNNADLLRELSKINAAIGNIDIAQELISRAHEIRPSGPVIKNLKEEFLN